MKKLILSLIFITFCNINAQEIGLSAGRIISDNSGIGNPYSYGFFLSSPGNQIKIRIQYSVIRNLGVYRLCYAVKSICDDLLIYSVPKLMEHTVTSFETIISTDSFKKIKKCEINIGFGAGINTSVINNKKKYDVLVGEHEKIQFLSLSGLLIFTKEKPFGFPFYFNILYKYTRIMKSKYFDDDFNGILGNFVLNQIDFNISYRF